MTEPYTNTRPMKNQRRLRGWLYGVGCAGLLLFLTICSSVGTAIYEDTPLSEREKLFLFPFNGRIYDLTPDIRSLFIFIGVIVVGFLLGREFNRWLYKE